MRILIFGATGMVGQGALRESFEDSAVTDVTTVGRTPGGLHNSKMKEVIHQDLSNLRSVESELSGFDACLFCLGTTSAGKTEDEYSRVTYDLTISVAETLLRLNPKMTFVYVSAEGADSSENGRIMWARVRGRTENKLFAMPFKGVYAFRPGIIRPMHGIQSKTTAYRLLYSVTKPVLPLIRKVLPGLVTTTEQLAKAMISVARSGAPKKVLKSQDFDPLTTPPQNR